MKIFIRYIALLIVTVAFMNSCNRDPGNNLVGKGAADIDRETEAIRWKMYTMSYSERSGGKLFLKYCAVCHGVEGQGDGFNSFNLDPRPRDLTDSSYMNSVSDSRLKEIIARGGRGTGKSVLMPEYAYTLSDHEINDLVNYIRHLGE
jgi:mono/diheme cytochrome c family protein